MTVWCFTNPIFKEISILTYFTGTFIQRNSTETDWNWVTSLISQSVIIIDPIDGFISTLLTDISLEVIFGAVFSETFLISGDSKAIFTDKTEVECWVMLLTVTNGLFRNTGSLIIRNDIQSITSVTERCSLCKTVCDRLITDSTVKEVTWCTLNTI